MVSVGVHFTLCGKDGNPKAVLWSDYLQRRPTSTQVINHLRDNQPIGIVPFSCNSAVVDVDAGDYHNIANRFQPYLVYPSTSGFPKAHLWYRTQAPPTQLNFEWLDCSGEIICVNHVAIPSPESNIVRLYESFLDSSNSLYKLPPIPPLHIPPVVDTGHRTQWDIGDGATAPSPFPPLIAEYALADTPQGERHNRILRMLVSWIKASATKPTKAEILEQCEYWRECVEDLRDFPATEVQAIAAWAAEKVQAGSISRTLTPEMRSNGGKVKGLRIRQKNFQRDRYILKLSNDGLSNRAIAARVSVSEGMVRKVIKRESSND